MQCRSTLTRIDSLRTGELSEAEVHEVTHHLSSCGSCNESLSDVEEFAFAIRGLQKLRPARSCASSVCEEVFHTFDQFDVDGQQVQLAFSSAGITRIDLGGGSRDDFASSYTKRFGSELRDGSVPDEYREAIERALRGEPTTLPPIDISRLSEFEQQVLRSIAKIPRGEARSYEWVARVVGRPKAVRAVGNVMASNPVPLLLPCHRVVPASGGLGGYGFGTPMKRRLLAAEDAPVDELESLARKNIRYVGSNVTMNFCFPTCTGVRKIRPDQKLLFRDAEEARRHGYRPCNRCSPVLAA